MSDPTSFDRDHERWLNDPEYRAAYESKRAELREAGRSTVSAAGEPRTPLTRLDDIIAHVESWTSMIEGDPFLDDLRLVRTAYVDLSDKVAEAEAAESRPSVTEHGPGDGCGDLIWAHMEADPSFNEEMRRGREDIAAGRVHKWADIRAGATPPIDVDTLAQAMTEAPPAERPGIYAEAKVIAATYDAIRRRLSETPPEPDPTE